MKRPGIVAAALALVLCGGCVYKGGKVVDGTNLAIGIAVPGTEWTVNALDYVSGVRVAGQTDTHIAVTHDVAETNSYFGVVHTRRTSRLVADITPLEPVATNAAETVSADVATNAVPADAAKE